MNDDQNDPACDPAREILRSRARTLRTPAENLASMESSIEVILFTLAGEKYAIETKAVGEVFPADSWTALPGTPDFILGATNYCGNIVPIVDLRPLFGLSATPPKDCARVILLEDALSPLGILAETVTGIEIIDRSEIHPMPPTIGMARSGHMLGLAPGHCALLDSVAIRGDESLFV